MIDNLNRALPCFGLVFTGIRVEPASGSVPVGTVASVAMLTGVTWMVRVHAFPLLFFR